MAVPDDDAVAAGLVALDQTRDLGEGAVRTARNHLEGARSARLGMAAGSGFVLVSIASRRVGMLMRAPETGLGYRP